MVKLHNYLIDQILSCKITKFCNLKKSEISKQRKYKVIKLQNKNDYLHIKKNTKFKILNCRRTKFWNKIRLNRKYWNHLINEIGK